ncbi:MAG: hypothetical protein GKC10_02885 [Methanosarcinales archaeon]|nr:hypothetical protein [Methanosarcinales archaeon]
MRSNMRCHRFIIVIGLMALLVAQAGAQTSHYLASDPAVREMRESLDMPRPSTAGDAAASDSLPMTAPLNVSGIWHLELTDGTSIDLALNQSDDVLFGRGNVTAPPGLKQAAVSGMVSGSNLKLDVVPTDGMELYAISLDVSKLPLAGSYTRFGVYIEPQSGTARAAWMPY